MWRIFFQMTSAPDRNDKDREACLWVSQVMVKYIFFFIKATSLLRTGVSFYHAELLFFERILLLKIPNGGSCTTRTDEPWWRRLLSEQKVPKSTSSPLWGWVFHAKQMGKEQRLWHACGRIWAWNYRVESHI